MLMILAKRPKKKKKMYITDISHCGFFGVNRIYSFILLSIQMMNVTAMRKTTEEVAAAFAPCPSMTTDYDYGLRIFIFLTYIPDT